MRDSVDVLLRLRFAVLFGAEDDAVDVELWPRGSVTPLSHQKKARPRPRAAKTTREEHHRVSEGW